MTIKISAATDFVRSEAELRDDATRIARLAMEMHGEPSANAPAPWAIDAIMAAFILAVHDLPQLGQTMPIRVNNYDANHGDHCDAEQQRLRAGWDAAARQLTEVTAARDSLAACLGNMLDALARAVDAGENIKTRAAEILVHLDRVRGRAVGVGKPSP